MSSMASGTYLYIGLQIISVVTKPLKQFTSLKAVSVIDASIVEDALDLTYLWC